MKFRKAVTTMNNVVRELVSSDQYYSNGQLNWKAGKSEEMPKDATDGIITAAMAMSCFGFSALPSNAAMNENSVLLGDVHGDDGVTGTDATYIGYYLEGRYEATAKQITAMDVNQDGLIDSRDATTLLSMLASGTTFPRVNYVYELPNDTDVIYYKHYCSSTNTNSKDSYSIQRNSVLSVSSLTEDEILLKADENANNRSAFLDYENIGSVELVITDFNNTVYHESGFVVGENVVATSAKNLYDGGFVKSVTVNVYNSTCSHVMDSADAVTIHIPKNYVVSGGSPNENYDYGLVYLGDDVDFSDYAVNFGVMTNEFLKTSNYNELTTSGFAYNSNEDKWLRYFSYGYVQTITDSTQKPYRFHSLGMYKKGGMVYSGFTTSTKRVVGISTHTSSSGTDTYGIRITPTLLRFYLQNNNLS